MALVLRKAVLPKNASFLKCLKGRPLLTATNKKNAAPITSAVASRSLKTRPLHLRQSNVVKAKQLFFGKRRATSKTIPVRFCMSCPNLIPESRARMPLRPRHFSPPRTRPILNDFVHLQLRYIATHNVISRCSEPLKPKSSQAISKRAFSKPCACGCPCPAPCGPYGCPGGCGCLPPPCNQPPRCLQYITGYYYYPYGTWFCGPYHVTGTCYPVGASGPCPCGPCGPCAPCGPCGPCAKCCLAPACVCPAASVLSSSAAHPPGMNQKPGPIMPSPIMPNPMANPVNSPINNPFNTPKDPKSRVGISKFFPFNTTTASVHTSDPKPKPEPFRTMSFWPYSNQATNTPSNSKKCSSTQSRPYSKLSHRPKLENNDKCTMSDTSGKPEYDMKHKSNRSPIRHKRHRYFCQMCSQSEKPQSLLASDLWNGPNISSRAYAKFPGPSTKNSGPRPYMDIGFKAYDL